MERALVGRPEGELEENARYPDKIDIGVAEVFYIRHSDSAEFRCVEYPSGNEWFDVTL